MKIREKTALSMMFIIVFIFITITKFLTTKEQRISLLRTENTKINSSLSTTRRSLTSLKERKGTNRVHIYTQSFRDFYEAGLGGVQPPRITWADIVIVILIYDNVNVNELIQANFATWMRRTGEGLDVVFVTDATDDRTVAEILPNIGKIKSNIHICRSRKILDGKRARAKVLDALFYVEHKFKDSDKKFFIKTDPDAYIRPEKLLRTLDKIYTVTGDQPVDFGYALCQTDSCYTEGGLYGLSKLGLTKSIEYVQQNPSLFNEFIPALFDESKNLLHHEDYFTSYVFYKATNYPSIFVHDVSMNLVTKERSGKHQDPISVHPVKSPKEYYVLDMLYYDEYDVPRGRKVSKELFLPLKDLFEFTKLRWNVKQEKYTVGGDGDHSS